MNLIPSPENVINSNYYDSGLLQTLKEFTDKSSDKHLPTLQKYG